MIILLVNYSTRHLSSLSRCALVPGFYRPSSHSIIKIILISLLFFIMIPQLSLKSCYPLITILLSSVTTYLFTPMFPISCIIFDFWHDLAKYLWEDYISMDHNQAFVFFISSLNRVTPSKILNESRLLKKNCMLPLLMLDK